MAAPTEWDGYRARVGAGLLKADFVIAPTRSFLDDIEQLYDIDLGARQPFRTRGAEASASASSRAIRVLLRPGMGRGEGLTSLIDSPPACRGRCSSPAPPQARRQRMPHPAHAHALGSLRQDELATWLAGASPSYCPPATSRLACRFSKRAMSGCPLVLGDLDTLRELLGRRRRLRSDA